MQCLLRCVGKGTFLLAVIITGVVCAPHSSALQMLPNVRGKPDSLSLALKRSGISIALRPVQSSTSVQNAYEIL